MEKGLLPITDDDDFLVEAAAALAAWSITLVTSSELLTRVTSTLKNPSNSSSFTPNTKAATPSKISSMFSLILSASNDDDDDEEDAAASASPPSTATINVEAVPLFLL